MRIGDRRRRRVVPIVLIGIGLALGAIALQRMPRPVDAAGVLDECLGGWPVIRIEDDGWLAARPDTLPEHAPIGIPIASWPDGLRYDESMDRLVDAAGRPVLAKGERARVRGTLIEVDGDPSPCFFTRGIRLDSVVGA